MNSFSERIERFVAEKTGDYEPSSKREKVIHDPIWGSVLFYGWEIQLIDSPLLQRLRDIHQLGMADLTYTAARHSRFEHSLGTAAVAGRMMQRLYERYRNSGEIRITESDIYKVRLAALLHDVGHCFFSHLSENVYGAMPEFSQVHDGYKCSPHEFMSYSIIKSKAFCDFFYEKIDFPEKGDRASCERLLLEAANMVVGIVNYDGDTALAYMTSIINGEFDADKTDYTQRDSYTAGIAMTYGIDRFLLKLILYCDTADGKSIKLAVGTEALTTVEELIFNRNILYVYMYRHQKVLATEAVLRDVIYAMTDLGYLREPCDFLDFGDNDIENLKTCTDVPFREYGNKRSLGEMINRIKKRQLPKRYEEFSLESIKENGKLSELDDYGKIAYLTEQYGHKDFESLMTVRRKLYKDISEKTEGGSLKKDFGLFDIYPVFPKPFKSDTSFLLVSKDNKARPASEIKYIMDWAAAFAAEKWRGYIFMN